MLKVVAPEAAERSPGVEFGRRMPIDSRRAAAALWTAWVVAGALGGALETLLIIAGRSGTPDNPDQLTGLAYDITVGAAGAIFQYLLLRFVTAGGRAVALWVPASVVAMAVYLQLQVFWFAAVNNFTSWLSATLPSLASATTFNAVVDGNVVTYALAFGAFQGVVLMLMTGRKPSVAIWMAGNLAALPVSIYVARLMPVDISPPPVIQVALNSIFTGAYALATGLALVVILRMPRLAGAVVRTRLDPP